MFARRQGLEDFLGRTSAGLSKAAYSSWFAKVCFTATGVVLNPARPIDVHHTFWSFCQ